MLRWIVRRRSRRRPWRRMRSRRTSRARMRRARRSASAWAAATSSGSTMRRTSTRPRLSARLAPPRRPRPPEASLAGSSPRSTWSGMPPVSLPAKGAGSRPRGRRPSAAVPDRGWRRRSPRPSQSAWKISSNRSQSERVAESSAFSAGCRVEGCAASGVARTRSASSVSRRPRAKPLSRSVRTKPASCRRRPAPGSLAGSPLVMPLCPATGRPPRG